MAGVLAKVISQKIESRRSISHVYTLGGLGRCASPLKCCCEEIAPNLTKGVESINVATVLLVLDNYDSFTYNLVQYFGELGVLPVVYRNDQLTTDQAEELKPEAIVISPGPCSPDEAGQSLALIERFAGKVPLLGVCLGHQCIGQYFGGRVVRAERLMHGKTSPIHHEGKSVFAGLPNPFDATRYHSLIVERKSLPDCLEITAETAEKEIMGLRHKDFEVHGVQFHPESLATLKGKRILENFLHLSGLLPTTAASCG